MEETKEQGSRPKIIQPAPTHLSEKSRHLWNQIVDQQQRDLSPSALMLLEQALSSLDRAEGAREEILKTGLTTVTGRSGVSHLNPLLRTEREHRALFAKIMQQLHLGCYAREPQEM